MLAARRGGRIELGPRATRAGLAGSCFKFQCMSPECEVVDRLDLRLRDRGDRALACNLFDLHRQLAQLLRYSVHCEVNRHPRSGDTTRLFGRVSADLAVASRDPRTALAVRLPG